LSLAEVAQLQKAVKHSAVKHAKGKHAAVKHAAVNHASSAPRKKMKEAVPVASASRR
jgi:hypothetical protein